MSCDIEGLLREIRREAPVDRDGVPRMRSVRGVELLDRLKDCIIDAVAGERLREAEEWLRRVAEAYRAVSEKLGLSGVTYPKEFRSFIEDPRQHLKKKLFIYAHDLVRGRIDVDTFLSKAYAAIRTSLRTNMRSAYQVWGLLTILGFLADEGYSLVYPEHRFLNIDRSGKQRLGIIPPNAVLLNLERGFLSFFHEAPRPLTWEDSSDLTRIWGFYTALRPDLMVYGGKVMNIVDLGSSPPIKRPTVIIEFKELEDWYTRTRDLKGYFRKRPLTAEEWRSKWIDGLYDGLADVLGVKRSEVRRSIEQGRSLRVREHRLVKLYHSVYKPRHMVLICRKKVPGEIREELENEGIEVFDGVEFSPEKLRLVAELLDRYAEFTGADKILIELDPETATLLAKASRALGMRYAEVIRHALEKLIGDESPSEPDK